MSGKVRRVAAIAGFALAISSGVSAQAASSADEIRKWLDAIRAQGASVRFDAIESSADGASARALGVTIETPPAAGRGATTKISLRVLSVTRLDETAGSIKFDFAHADDFKLMAGDATFKAAAVDLKDVSLPRMLDAMLDARQPTASLVRFAQNLFAAHAGAVTFADASWSLPGDSPGSSHSMTSLAVEGLESGSIAALRVRGLAGATGRGEGVYRVAEVGLEHVSPAVLIGAIDPQSYRTAAVARPWKPIVGRARVAGLETRGSGSHMAMLQLDCGPLELRQLPFDPTPILDLVVVNSPKLRDQPSLMAKFADGIAESLRVGKASVRNLVSDDGAEPPNRGASADAIDLIELAPRSAKAMNVTALRIHSGDGGFQVGQIGVGDVEFAGSAQVTGGAANLPRFSHLALNDIALVRPGAGASLGSVKIAASDYLGKAPTRVEATLEGVSIPVAALPPSALKANLTDLKLEKLELTAAISADWQEVSEEFHLSSAQISAAGVGELAATAALTGVSRGVFEHPETLSEVLANAQIQKARISFRDSGLTQRVLDKFAEVNKLSVNKVRSALTAAMPTLFGSITDAASRNRLIFAAVSFLNDPNYVAVFSTMETPQPLTKTLDVLRNSPQSLPGLLKLDATANRSS